MQLKRPVQISYLFRRGRDTLLKLKMVGARSKTGPVGALRWRLKQAEKEIGTYARNLGAWSALGFNDKLRSKDNSRGFFTDQDCSETNNIAFKWDKMKASIIDPVIKFYLTEQEASRYQDRLFARGKEATIHGWKTALKEVVFTHKPNDLLTRGRQASLQHDYLSGSAGRRIPKSCNAAISGLLKRWKNWRLP